MEERRFEQLVIRAREQDPEAFALIYEEIYKDMYRFAYYNLNNCQDAEDAVSEAVTDAYDSIAKLREPLAFRGWIFKILAAKCKQKQKTYINRPEPLNLELSGKPDDPDSRTDLTGAFLKLKPKERMIVSLSVFAGYKSVEISRLLHMNHNTVRSTYSRALEKMKQLLEH